MIRSIKYRKAYHVALCDLLFSFFTSLAQMSR